MIWSAPYGSVKLSRAANSGVSADSSLWVTPLTLSHCFRLSVNTLLLWNICYNHFKYEYVKRTTSHFTMLFNFILCDSLGGFDVDEVLSHLLQLGSFHKKLQEGKTNKWINVQPKKSVSKFTKTHKNDTWKILKSLKSLKTASIYNYLIFVPLSFGV